MKSILFISHNTGRNGAPIVLLHLLRWLKENTDLPIRILCKSPGPLGQKRGHHLADPDQ
jgi:hypothetical protein